MGNTNSTSLDFEYNLSVSDYALHKKYRDFVFGEFFEVKHVRTGELLLMKVRILSDAEKYRQNSQRFALSHPSLIKIKGFAGKASKTSNESSHKIYVYFAPLPKDLAEFIKARKKNPLFKEQSANSKNFFSESELEQIATQLIDVLEYLQNNNITHGDLRPEACFMTEAGKVMICDRQLIYEEELDNSLEKNNRKNFLFSPEMFESLTKPGVNFKEPSTKSDVFSLGMTLLECATFRRSASLYEWTENPCINFSGLVNRLDEVQTRYSPKIYQIIAEMLKFDEQSRPDFVKLKRWISGAEALSYRAVSHSPHHKKWPSGPQLNRSNLGPKMNVTSPRVMHNFAGTNFALTSKNKDSTLFDSSVFRPNRRIGLDEDEVVEFETEESPKRSHHLANQQVQDSRNAYINIINKNHKPLTWRAPPNAKFVEKESSGRASNKTLDTYLAGLGNFHDAHTYINGFDTPSNSIQVEFKSEKESTFGAKDLKAAQINSESSSPDTKNRTPVKVNRNFIYPVVETGKPNSYLKASSYDANNPFTALPYTQQQLQPSAFKTAATNGMDSPSFATSDRFSATSSVVNPFIMEAPPLKPANHRSNSDGSYISKLNEDRRNEEYFSRHSGVSKPFNPAIYLKTPSPYHIHESPLLSGEQIPASSHLKKSSGKLDTSLNIGSYGEIEQWRSPMDGATYNSILSVNTHSPRTGKNSTNNLQSRPFSPYSAQSDSQQKGFAEACHRLTSQHSCNSIDGAGIEENTPQFKETNIRKPGYLDDNLAFYNYKTPMERMTHDPTNYGGSLNKVSTEAASITLVKSRSYKDAMPGDRDSIRAEIDMILQNTTLSKRQSHY